MALLGVTTGVYYLMRANGKSSSILAFVLVVVKKYKCLHLPMSVYPTHVRRRCSHQDHDQGVARGIQRACSRAKGEPHHWYLERRLQGQGSRSVRISRITTTTNPHKPKPFFTNHRSPLFHISRLFTGRKDNLDPFAQHRTNAPSTVSSVPLPHRQSL